MAFSFYVQLKNIIKQPNSQSEHVTQGLLGTCYEKCYNRYLVEMFDRVWLAKHLCQNSRMAITTMKWSLNLFFDKFRVQRSWSRNLTTMNSVWIHANMREVWPYTTKNSADTYVSRFVHLNAVNVRSDASICICLLTFRTCLYEIINTVRMQHVYSIKSTKSDVMQSCFFLCPLKQKKKEIEVGGGYTYKRTRTSFHFRRSLLTREGGLNVDDARNVGTDGNRLVI